MFSCRRRKTKSDASVLFIFIAAVGTLILAAFVLQLSSVKRTAVDDRPPTVSSGGSYLLPDMVSEPVKRAELNLLAEPATALAYRQDERQLLGLMQWDRRSGKNVLRSSIILRGELNEVELPELTVEQFGWGRDAELGLRWSTADSDVDLMTYVMVDGLELKQLKVERSSGISNFELFEVGDTLFGETNIEISDVDGDDVAELFASTVDQNGNKIVDVYLWTGDRLTWSAHWSKAMTAREGMFPEPGE